MKLDELFYNFSFHDGDIWSITKNQDDIIISFSLPMFLQSKQLKEIYKTDKNRGDSYLELVLRFEHLSKFESDPLVNVNDIDCEEYELWDMLEDEKNQETIIQLRKYGEDNLLTVNLLTISFVCKSVEIISCACNTEG